MTALLFALHWSWRMQCDVSSPSCAATAYSEMALTTPTVCDAEYAGEITSVKGDIFLSPSCRLLADMPGPAQRVLDGRGHRLVLPTGVDAQERLPLILVGAGKTLQLRNITIVHSSSLAACLHLGAGAQLTHTTATFGRLAPLHIATPVYVSS